MAHGNTGALGLEVELGRLHQRRADRLRAAKLGTTTGCMVTASHNDEPDNGVKICESGGDMMAEAWESHAAALANAESTDAALEIVTALAEAEGFAPDAPAEVYVAMDSRPSSSRLAELVVRGVEAMGGTVHSYGLMTTPQLHHCVRVRNAARVDGGGAQRVLELRDEGTPLEGMAVLYRSHFHALELQMEFTRRDIPFVLTSGIRFFEQAHVKDVAAYLKLLVNPGDELAFKRIVLMLPGVGAKSAAKLWSAFTTRLAKAPGLAKALREIAGHAPKKAALGWEQFAETLGQLADEQAKGPGHLIRMVVAAGYEDYLQEKFPNYYARLEDLEQVAGFAEQYETPEAFLSEVALLTNLDTDTGRDSNADPEQIRLSTIHQAKGLEFDAVFVMMLCDGMFPSSRAIESPDGEEEERRLFYVAVTRAKTELYLSYPLLRFMHGSGGETMQQRSRFLDEIDPDILEEWNLQSFDSYG